MGLYHEIDDFLPWEIERPSFLCVKHNLPFVPHLGGDHATHD